MTAYARYEPGGLMRCCAQSIPTDPQGRVMAGTEGEHRPCQWCKDKESRGVRFHDGVWRAAWIDEEKP